jgi:choline kinase
MMRAVILAAGRGSRMGQLSDDRPKCLFELAGKPLIERQMAALRRGGAHEIGVVRGYRAGMIDFPGLAYFTNERWAETNMVRSLAAAAPWLRSGPVIVSYADIFYRSELVRGLAATPGSLSISYDRAWRSLWTQRFSDPLADAETFRIDAAGRLLEIGGKTTRMEDIQGQYMGLLKFTPPAWSAVEALLAALDPAIADRLDMTALLRRLLAVNEFPISTFGTAGQWGEIDNPEDAALYENLVRQGELVLEDAPPELVLMGRGIAAACTRERRPCPTKRSFPTVMPPIPNWRPLFNPPCAESGPLGIAARLFGSFSITQVSRPMPRSGSPLNPRWASRNTCCCLPPPFRRNRRGSPRKSVGGSATAQPARYSLWLLTAKSIGAPVTAISIGGRVPR